MNQTNKAKLTLVIINSVVLLLITILLFVLGFYFWDDLKLLATPEGQIEFGNRIRTTGFLGVFIMIVLQLFQVVVAFLPGEFIEIVTGMLFGPIGGMFVCLIGLSLGTICIFGLVKVLGKPFLELNINSKKKKRLKFLENKTRALIILFFVFLIPGTPKDFITYAVPFTKIKLVPFLIVSSIARIPSVISSTIIGDQLANGEMQSALILTTVIGVIAIIGIIFSKPITEKVELAVIKYQERKNK